MTDKPPIRSATPDDIEAALQSVRAQLLPPEDQPEGRPAETAPVAAPRPPKPPGFARIILVGTISGALGALLATLVLSASSGQDDTLSARIAALEQSQAGTATGSDLENRLTALENLVTRRLVRNAGLAIVVSQLTLASESGRPFVTELNTLRQIAPEIDMSAFQPVAASGIPSTAVLLAQLIAITADPPRPWIQGVLEALFGPAAPPPPSNDPYARARALAGKGDLAAAVQVLSARPESGAEPLAAWLRASQQRLTFDAALSALSASLLRDLTRPAP